MSDEKLYSEKEIKKILQLASAIQAKKGELKSSRGLSQAELINLAKESGIDEQTMLEAIDSMTLPNQKTQFNWFGATSTLVETRTFSGKLIDENWDEIVALIRRELEGIGRPYKTGNTFEWEQRKRSGFKHVMFSPTKGGRMNAQMVFNWNRLNRMITAFSTMGAFILGILISKGFGNEPNMLWLLPTAGAFGFGVSRLILKNYYEHQKRKVNKLLDSVVSWFRSEEKEINKIELPTGEHYNLENDSLKQSNSQKISE